VSWFRETFEIARGGEARNNRPMEGLRGLAVSLVFFVHFAALVQPWIAASPRLGELSRALHDIGGGGVDLFFVLSGYLIYGSLIARRQTFRTFFARRLERLYPAFGAVLALYVGLSLVFPEENRIPAGALAGGLYLVQNLALLPGIFPIVPIITVAWSLSYEMLFYLLIPLLVGVLGMRWWRAGSRALFFGAVALLCLVYGALYGGHVRMMMFVSGILLYETVRAGRLRTPGSAAAAVALGGGLLALGLPGGNDNLGIALRECVMFASFFVVCLACFRDPYGRLTRAFTWTPLRWLGNMSYSYYLIHGLALKGLFRALSILLPPAVTDSWFFWAVLPAAFAFTLLPSAALFVLIERPFSLRRARRSAPLLAERQAA
jgi:peptidoglycan/LPS O-acetylase OafA/YrhL